MAAPLTNPSRLASDAGGLDALRHSAAKDPRAAARDAAKQFESLFMNELMKSMRAASEPSGLLDNAGTQLGTQLLDAQLASKMVGRPGGLSEVIARQLERQMGLTPGPISSTTSRFSMSAMKPTCSAADAGMRTRTTRDRKSVV